MKEFIATQKWISIILILVFIGIVVSGVIYFTLNYFKYQDELDQVITREIKGIVVKSEYQSRGFFLIEIDDQVSNTILHYSLPKSWFFKDNNIEVNDSVSKAANSRIMSFYMLKNGSYQKCCDYEVEM